MGQGRKEHLHGVLHVFIFIDPHQKINLPFSPFENWKSHEAAKRTGSDAAARSPTLSQTFTSESAIH